MFSASTKPLRLQHLKSTFFSVFDSAATRKTEHSDKSSAFPIEAFLLKLEEWKCSMGKDSATDIMDLLESGIWEGLEEIGGALKKENSEELRLLAHRFKGLCLNIESSDTPNYPELFEAAIIDKDLAQIENIYKKMTRDSRLLRSWWSSHKSKS